MQQILYDITVPIHSAMPVYEGDDPIITTPVLTVEESGIANITGIQNFTTHFGTHVDPPLHFVSGGKSLDEVPLEKFWGKARVIQIENSVEITPEELEKSPIGPGDILLFKTRNSSVLHLQEFQRDHVYISRDAALYLVEQQVKLVGIDYLSVDKYGDEEFPAHRILLSNGVIILESANLQEVPPGLYMLVCLPLKIKGADGAPARAVLTQFVSEESAS